MSAFTDQDILFSQVITVLDAEDAVWDVCCGPNGEGTPQDDLFALLQVRFPEDEWDQELFDKMIRNAKRAGIVKEYANSTFFLNAGMVQVNHRNVRFQIYSNKICGPRPTEQLVPILL